MMIMDWGLQAVVIGSSSSCSANNIDFSPKLDFQESDHQYLSFSHEMKKEFFSDELEELYKPFYHVDGGQNMLMGSSISLIPKEIIKEEKREEEQQQVVAPTSTYVPKYKKR